MYCLVCFKSSDYYFSAENLARDFFSATENGRSGLDPSEPSGQLPSHAGAYTGCPLHHQGQTPTQSKTIGSLFARPTIEY